MTTISLNGLLNSIAKPPEGPELLPPKTLEHRSESAGPDPRVCIVTALNLETFAVRSVFDGNYRMPGKMSRRCPMLMYVLNLKREDGKSEDIILCECSQMGNNAASIAATAILMMFPSITEIVMVGIAGGVPQYPVPASVTDAKDHVRLGDIVFASEIFQYDMVKLEPVSMSNRGKSRTSSAVLSVADQELRQETFDGINVWRTYIDAAAKKTPRFKRPSKDRLYIYDIDDDGNVSGQYTKHPLQKDREKNVPLVHRGKIGSANILLKNNKVRDSLRLNFGVRAVEMEGSGIADAAWNFEVGFGVIRGVCDYCDPAKSDEWQPHAALCAAAYAKAIIERVPS
jgi:nucleoside phosphorylase